jgi:polyisoprenoid-binding protein YceI
MTNQTKPRTPAPIVPGRSSRKHHWWRWALAGAAVLVVLVVAAVGILIKLQPAPPPLTLPSGAASAPAGPIDGTWKAGASSVAGFRLQESALGMSNDVVGRTNTVTGTILISGDTVTKATFRIGLTTIKIGGKTQPQIAKSLGTQDHPTATLTLTQPVTLGSAFTSGATITATATAYLTMNGSSHPVTITISGRRDGSALQAAGSIPITLSTWGIKEPARYGFLGSLANHGAAEFLLLLHRQ